MSFNVRVLLNILDTAGVCSQAFEAVWNICNDAEKNEYRVAVRERHANR